MNPITGFCKLDFLVFKHPSGCFFYGFGTVNVSVLRGNNPLKQLRQGTLGTMLEKLESLATEFEALERSLGDPELIGDQTRYREAMQRYSDLTPIVKAYKDYDLVLKRLAEAEDLLSDPDMSEIAQEELRELTPVKEKLEGQLEKLLLPKDPYDDKNVIMEIRAAAGGDEASLFAGDILNMYIRYAEALGFQAEMLDSYQTDVGGFSKVSFEIKGRGAYSVFKYESGVHRVQRVPDTETQGRIHTSTITVAVLPEAEDVDVNLSPSDYRVDEIS